MTKKTQYLEKRVLNLNLFLIILLVISNIMFMLSATLKLLLLQLSFLGCTLIIINLLYLNKKEVKQI